MNPNPTMDGNRLRRQAPHPVRLPALLFLVTMALGALVLLESLQSDAAAPKPSPDAPALADLPVSA